MSLYKRYKRVFLIVLDSFGAGPMEDSKDYGDENADTMGHVAEAIHGIAIPHLRRLGLANLRPLYKVDPVPNPKAYFTTLKEASVGKDTLTGHWEMMGLKTEKPFVSFTDTGFPPELIRELEEKTGHKVIGNKSASGTVILDELGEEAIATGSMIVYTSADSVLQICASEETFGLDELYRCCRIAREITKKEEWKVGRVIARPYVGRKKGEFKRTGNRHDYALSPHGRTVLDAVKRKELACISIGKIVDIFNAQGITESIPSQSSVQGMEQAIYFAEERPFTGICFVNLVDFDMLWGHRRNPYGYAQELQRFDRRLGRLLMYLRKDDLLILTADHGNDPAHTGTDHTREKVPFIAYSPGMEGSGPLPERETFADIGATIAENFEVDLPEGCIGTSLLEIMK